MTHVGNRSTVQTVALIFGAIYLAAGILGFFPFLGGSDTQTSRALLGLFNVNLLHNLVHVVIGIAGLAAASSLANSRTFCQVVGVILLLLGVIGIFVASPLGLLYIGGLDIALHLVTGAVLAYFGFAATVSTRTA
ncbi:MAG TPA: DUF4383 domain-containing protein [Candidatus Dormibacteraeota bacterium]|nr:DUF4383 domain-containing protein [Candidatus Dormibacteraeota bacterium]